MREGIVEFWVLTALFVSRLVLGEFSSVSSRLVLAVNDGSFKPFESKELNKGFKFDDSVSKVYDGSEASLENTWVDLWVDTDDSDDASDADDDDDSDDESDDALGDKGKRCESPSIDSLSES